MHIHLYFSRLPTPKSVRKILLEPNKSIGNHRYLKIYSQTKSSIFKFVQRHAFIRHATFGKYANACSVLQFLSSFLNRFFTTFGTASIHGYTRSFVKKAKQRHFLQFLFSDKYKWIFVQDKHQHDVHHRCVIGNKHIAALFVQWLLIVQLITESHTVK